MADQIPDSTNPDMSWIDIAVLQGGAVIVDAAPGWLKYFDGDIHVEDVFQCPVDHPSVPGLYRWAGFSIGSWDEGDGCVATGGTFTRAAPPAMDREAVKWRERWYGSEPQKGSAVVDERGNLIAYLGGDEATHAAVTQVVAAHNAALSTHSADAIRQGDGIENAYTADDAVDFVFNRLASKLGLSDWQVVEGSEEWEGDASATLHRLLVDAGIIDDETGAVATLAPRQRWGEGMSEERKMAPGVIGYRAGECRNEPNALSHTYAMMDDDSLWPMCGYGWNRSDGHRFSIFRGSPGTEGDCKLCARNVAAGKPPVTDGFPHKTRWL